MDAVPTNRAGLDTGTLICASPKARSTEVAVLGHSRSCVEDEEVDCVGYILSL